MLKLHYEKQREVESSIGASAGKKLVGQMSGVQGEDTGGGTVCSGGDK